MALAATAAAGRSERSVERRKRWMRLLVVIFESPIGVGEGVFSRPCIALTWTATLE